MDKHAINKFAVQARRDLIAGVTQRLNQLGITAQGAANKEDRSTTAAEYYAGNEQPLEGRDINRREDLVERLSQMAAKSDWQTAYQDLIEEVAYTWFNRIIAIRFMEVNDYLPSRTRVLSSLENLNEPDIMLDALELEDDLGHYSDAERALIQRAQERQQPNDLDAMYRMLFLKQVNALNKSLPKLFEKTDDFMKLLFTPSYNRGVIADLVKEIPETDFDISSDDSQGQVEIIGWLYQYYNQELKENAIGSPSSHKFRGKEIASATQIFTPDWIVKYMVQNSAGKMWIKHLMTLNPKLVEQDLAHEFGWQYYMCDAEQTAATQAQVDRLDAETLKSLKPEELTILDPSMGSGHILVYAFDLLIQIYKHEGHSEREAATQIVHSNLFGLDIDKRAFQLAYFSVMMKYRKYNRNALTSEERPQLATITSTDSISNSDIKTAFPTLKNNEIEKIIDFNKVFSHADVTGSLTDVENIDLKPLQDISDKIAAVNNLMADQICSQINALISLTQLLQRQYRIVVTNPPYMGSSRMNSFLSGFAKKQYPESKSDLFAMFLEHFNRVVKRGGYVAMVTMQSWMFLSSFEQLRIKLLNTRTISNLMHMENNVMGIAFGTAVTITRGYHLNDFIGTYHQVKTVDVSNNHVPVKLPIRGNRFNRTNQANFHKIAESPIIYWFPKKAIDSFSNFPPLSKVAELKAGLTTGDNTLFQRRWYEVSFSNICFVSSTDKTAGVHSERWYPCHTGGPFLRWYAKNELVVDWQDSGFRIRNYRNKSGKLAGRPQNTRYYFKPGITWNKLSSSKFGVKLRETGYIFDDTARTLFPFDTKMTSMLLGVLNSKVAFTILEGLNPSMSFTNGDLRRIPIVMTSTPQVEHLVDNNVAIVKTNVNSAESSWLFQAFPMLNRIAEHNRNWTVEAAYNQWAKEAEDRFNQLKANEEELNRIFINLYGLQDELTPEVADKDVSVRKADLPRDIKAFLSYFIGVVFGRYSLDVSGLAFAGGKWDDSKYKTFKPNVDDVILLTDEDYFGDQRDIINRLKEFLTVTFGEAHLDENLSFIASALGKKGNSPEEQIRKYFLDDFYKKDHLSTYKKRPIYWQLSAGRQGGFRALMYLHRYDENTLAMVRTVYLHPLQEAYENRRIQLQKMIEVETNTKQRNSMTKQVAKLGKQLDEISKYDIALQHVANMHITLDLDDGVLVNHKKVQGGQKLLDPLK